MKNFLYIVLILLFPTSLLAQTEDNSQLFINDMLTIAKNFAQPAADGVSYQASAGWFSSAEELEKWEWRISIHGNSLFISSDDKNFQLNNNDLELLELEELSSAELPTAFGESTNIFFLGDVTFENPLNGETMTEAVRFKGIDGINRSSVPHAFVQAAVGVSAGTELTVRAMPQVKIDGVTASTYGIGAKHSLSQYFRNNYPEDFQLALGAAYSKLNVEYEFNPISVENYLIMDLITVDANLLMAEIIGSKRWNILELFAAVGIMNSKFDYEMGGDGFALPRVNNELGKIEGNQTQFKGDLGFNIHYDRFMLSAMGSIGEFFNANVGLHVRI